MQKQKQKQQHSHFVSLQIELSKLENRFTLRSLILVKCNKYISEHCFILLLHKQDFEHNQMTKKTIWFKTRLETRANGNELYKYTIIFFRYF